MSAARSASTPRPPRLSRPLLDAADIGILEFSENGRLLSASPLACTLLGLPAAAPPAATPPSLDRALMDCVREAARRDGTAVAATVTGAGGAPLWATAARVPGDGGEPGVTCLLRSAQPDPEAVPPSEEVEILKAMVEAAQEALTVVSGAGVILNCNSRAVQDIGLEKADVIGRDIRDIVRAGHYDRSASLEVIARRTDVTLVQTLRDGRRLLASGKPIFSEDGALRYVVVTSQDITGRARLMATLQETTRLSERYRAELRRLELREVQAGEVVVRSAPMQAVRELALRCAAVDSPVLLLGETGTGKGVFAKLIHQASARSGGPFLEVNCSAIPEGLIEAELFGYARGAFTGADPKGKVGLIELADRGTLFLNEIGDLPAALQVKLLQFLEDGEIRPIGSVARKRPDVRILAATNRDLQELIARGSFRRDLFYRLNVLTIQLPPLRDRREDIPWLVDMVLRQLGRKLGRRPRLTPAALHRITQYDFPGNVRELRNLVERVAVTTDRETIDVGDLPAEVVGVGAGTRAPSAPGTLQDALRQVEAAMLEEALVRHGTQRRAARALGVTQATVSRKLRAYGLR